MITWTIRRVEGRPGIVPLGQEPPFRGANFMKTENRTIQSPRRYLSKPEMIGKMVSGQRDLP